jgi:hypothetical protein
VSLQQGLNFRTQSLIVATGAIEKGSPLGSRSEFDGVKENRLFRLLGVRHGAFLDPACRSQ